MPSSRHSIGGPSGAWKRESVENSSDISTAHVVCVSSRCNVQCLVSSLAVCTRHDSFLLHYLVTEVSFPWTACCHRCFLPSLLLSVPSPLHLLLPPLLSSRIPSCSNCCIGGYLEHCWYALCLTSSLPRPPSVSSSSSTRQSLQQQQQHRQQEQRRQQQQHRQQQRRQQKDRQQHRRQRE